MDKLSIDQSSAIIKRLPKVLLHTHLEGSTPLNTIEHLSKRNKINLPFPIRSDLIKDMIELGKWNSFLSAFNFIASCFKKRIDFYDAIYNYAACLSEENIVYAEVHCTPWIHFSRGIDLDDISKGLYDGIESAKKEYGISLGIIFDLTRSPDEDVNRIVDWMFNLPISHFVALGFSGGPDSIPYKNFEKYCNKIRKVNFRIVAHAGELEGPDSVRVVTERLQVDRISHGVRTIENIELFQSLIHKGLHFELCPTSNQILGVGGANFLSIKRMLKFGAKCSINTDDELLFNTCLTKEFNILVNKNIIRLSDIVKLIKNAIEAAFINDFSRHDILKKFDNALSPLKISLN